ncbi:CdaR family protein [Lachnospiraceae bacterium 46-15]
MKKKIVSNFWLKVMAVLVSFLIWLMVINGDDPVKTETFRNVPITVKNADVFMEKVKKVYRAREDNRTGQETDSVTVYVKARRSILERLSADSFTVTADFENIVEELNSIPLDISCSTVPTLTMKDMWCDLRSLKVELEDVKDATFVVSTKAEGAPANGYQVGGLEPVDGNSIAIAGPESDMRKIGKVEVAVEVRGLTKSKTVTAPIVIYDKNETQFTPSQMERLTIKTQDGKVFEEDQMKVRAVIWKVRRGIVPSIETTGTPAEGYQVVKVTTAPETIGLAGSKDVLEQLGYRLIISEQVSVEGAAETFSKEINLKEYLEENFGSTLIQEKDLSDIIVVTVQMEKIGTTTVRVPVSDIAVRGRPENMSYKLTPADYISLEIQPQSEQDIIKAEDVQVILDLSSSKYQTPGNYQVPLEVILPEGCVLSAQAKIAVDLVKTEPASEQTELQEE